eukprot:1155413-Pelagomonas_calceolata.AAC.2
MAHLDRRNSLAQCVYSGQPINVKDSVVDLRKRHRSVWPTEDQAELNGHPNDNNWVALPFRQNSAFGKPLHVPRGRRGNKEHSAPATATPPTSKTRHPSQLPPEQRHIHLLVKYCEDTRPKTQLEASKQQHRDLCHHLSRASAQVTLHTILLGVGGAIYTPHTLEPLKELGLDTRVTREKRHQSRRWS